MDYSKNLPDGFLYIDQSYKVVHPWYLGWVEIEEKLHGVKVPREYNILYTQFGIPKMEQFKLEMEYGEPFWQFGGEKWNIFKKRCNRFSEKLSRYFDLPIISYNSLEDLKERLSEEWLNG